MWTENPLPKLRGSILTHTAVATGLAVFLEAGLYFLPNNQFRYKVSLRVAQFVWGIFVVLPLSWMVFESVFSGRNG